jgi:two-component system response regulator HydG
MSDSEITPSNVLLVDDEREHAQVMCEALARQGHRCDVTYNLDEARGRLGKKRFDVIVTDMVMDGRYDGLEVLRESKKIQPPPPVILVTAHSDVPTCKQALQEGAYDYIEKPLDLEHFREQVNRAAEKSQLLKQNQILQEQLGEKGGFEGIIGKSAAMQQVVQTARQVAASDIPVLILGESGTGKELVARAIHNSSRRRRNRMVALNCAGLAESILEDELFGHEKGAFTNAVAAREGRFEHADKGTIMLDEIGDMPAAMQAKLLRVLENGEVVRLGSNEPIKVDVRLISATNRNLDELVAERKFREDLFFRIKGVTITIPPLRQRREDIPLLIYYFLKQAAERYGKAIEGLAPETQQALVSYSWPGNVRELKNVIENMVVLSPAETIAASSLPREIVPAAAGADGNGAMISGAAGAGGIDNLVGITMEQAEIELIRNTLKMTNGNREQAARILGIGERTLYRKIKEYGLH